MTKNPIPSSAKLPPRSLSEDTQDDQLPDANVNDTVRADYKDHIPTPPTANRE
ncbi:hypothetical protein SB748_25580 [Rhizobium sp. SIMBA_035]